MLPSIPLLILSSLLSSLLPTLLCISPAPTPSPTLIFVTELCRHGDRTPLYASPVDTFPLSKWPEGVGQLTAIGQRAHFNLGTRLRARFVDTSFLPPAYNANNVYIRSSNFDRTLDSATCQMAGLYPPGTAPNYDVRVRFGKDALHDNEGGLPHLYQPVPIHTTFKNNDNMLRPGANCPRHRLLVDRKYNSPQFWEKVHSERPFLRAVAKVVNMDVKDVTMWKIVELADTWTVQAAHSVPLPEGATPDIVSHAKNISDWTLTFTNTGLEINRLRSGLILNEVRVRFTALILKTLNKLPKSLEHKTHRFLLLSAHDTTLAALLSALQVYDGVNPPYNSTVIWQGFLTHDNQPYIQVEYNGKPLLLPGCSDTLCPLAEYIASTNLRTLPGEEARFNECLTGWRRYAAMLSNSVQNPFIAKKKDDLTIPATPDPKPPTTHPILFVFLTLVAAVASVAIVLAGIRISNARKGYSVPREQHVNDMYGLTADNSATARILM